MFENIIGHDENKKILKKYIEENNINHAYLFEGINGIGKKVIAQEFAKKILKTDKLETCPDYIYIEKYEDKKDIVVEQIRNNLISSVFSKPISSNKKVYIINDAQNMNISAQNALLKTLEEPPEYVVIILISNQMNKFLPTIKSRVKLIKFNGLSENEIRNYLEKNKVEGINDFLIKYANGSISKIIEIDKEEILNYNKVVEIVDNLSSKYIYEIIISVKNINFKEDDYLEYMQFVCINKYKKTLNYAYLLCIEIIEKAIRSLKYNGNYDIVVDNMLINMHKILRSK